MFKKEIFAQRVKAVLKEKGLTQKIMADSIRMTPGAVSKYLNISDALLPNLETLSVMSDFLGVSTDWLLGRSDSKRVGDSVSARDICKSIMRFNDIPCLNIQTISVRQFCNYGEQGYEHRENEYPAFYFSDFWQYDVSDSDFIEFDTDGNGCPYATAINRFIKAFHFILKNYEIGVFDKEQFDSMINSLLTSVPDDPLPSRNTQILSPPISSLNKTIEPSKVAESDPLSAQADEAPIPDSLPAQADDVPSSDPQPT